MFRKDDRENNFGDVIEKIRLFSPDTQRTFKEISEYTVVQREVSVEKISDWTFFDCFKGKKATLIINAPERCKEHLERFAEPEIVDNWNALIEDDQISKYFILDQADSSEYYDKSRTLQQATGKSKKHDHREGNKTHLWDSNFID